MARRGVYKTELKMKTSRSTVLNYMQAAKLIPALCLAGLLLGCSTQYVMKLSNGTHLVVKGKPKLKGPTYYYKDATGQVNTIPQSRVIEVEPASMATEETSFKPHYPTPKRHWWQFWR